MGRDTQKEDLIPFFCEGAVEFLADLDEALLRLEENPRDRREIDRVFRSMHSLKGAAAMLGFTEMSEFAHHFETEFDAIREGRGTVNSEIISISLAAEDYLRELVEARKEGRVPDTAPGEGILARLRGFNDSRKTVSREIFRETGRELMKTFGEFLGDLRVHQDDRMLLGRIHAVVLQIQTTARKMGKESLYEFLAEFSSLFAEARLNHLPVSPDLFELLEEGFREALKFLPEKEEEVSTPDDFDPVRLMEEIEKPRMILAKLKEYKGQNRVFPSPHERKSGPCRTFKIRISKYAPDIEPALLLEQLKFSGICSLNEMRECEDER